MTTQNVKDLYYSIEIVPEQPNKPDDNFKTTFINVSKKYLIMPLAKVATSKCGQAITLVISASVGLIVYVATHYAGDYSFRYSCV